ncbi:hypothetical protein [Accumulibacter sp.]|uniref:hypothetical protein n=1 Tax=Accumulibacter sp. TaxID=2053492 RepID=UPI0035B0E138
MTTEKTKEAASNDSLSADVVELGRLDERLGFLAKEAGKRLTHSSILEALREQQIGESRKLQNSLRALADKQAMELPHIASLERNRLQKMPTPEETQQFQSAAVLLRQLAASIADWRQQLPNDFQPAIVALLNGGAQIEVESLAQETFHGIRITGTLNGTPCVVLAHQATVQLLCWAQPVEPPERPRRPIGFIIDGLATEA